MFNLLAVQGTLKSLLQHHNSNTSVLQCSDSFMVQLSYLCMAIEKTTVLTFVNKVMSLLFIKKAYYAVQVCHSFPSKEQVSFNFMAAVTVHSEFRAPQKKICHYSHFRIKIKWDDVCNICYPLLLYHTSQEYSVQLLSKTIYTDG